MVGQRVQEEEPEGEVIVRPSGEAVEPWSSGYTPSFSLELNCLHFLDYTASSLYESPFFQELIHLINTSAY